MARKGPAERLAEQRAAQAAAQKKGKAVQTGGLSRGQKRPAPQVDPPSSSPGAPRLRLLDEDTPARGATEPILARPLTAVHNEIVGNTFLGLRPDRVEMVAALKGKRPEFYFDYVGVAFPTPSTFERLPQECKETMEVPARAWTRQTKLLADQMSVQDLLCAGMALQGQSFNFLVMANGKIQLMEKELDSLRLQAFKLRKTVENEQYLRGIVESKLTTAGEELEKIRSDSELKEKELQLEKENRAKMEDELAEAKKLAAEASKSAADLTDLVRVTGGGPGSVEELKAAVIEEYKGSAQFNSDLKETYVQAFKDVIEVVEKARPEFDVGFLKADLEKYREEQQIPPTPEVEPTADDEEALDVVQVDPSVAEGGLGQT